MKKILTLFIALSATVLLFAAQVRQNVWGGSLALTNDEFKPHQETLFAAGQTLRITFVNNSGWMQVFHKDGNNGWTSTDLVDGLDLNAGYVEVVLSSTAVEQIRNFGGLYIKGENVTLKSVDVIYDNGVAPEMDKRTLWNGEYINEVEINSEQVATMKSGNVIRVHVSVPDGGANFKIVYKGEPDWSETTIPSIDNQWPWVNGGETYKDFTLTDADITAIAGKGIYIYKGDNSVITKVELLQPAWVAASTWTGSIVGETETEISASYFTSAVAGNKLRIHFTKNVEDSYYQMSVIVKDASWICHYYMNYGTVLAPVHDIELETGDKLDNLVARGLYVFGKNITITKVELLREKVSTDDVAAVAMEDADPTALLQDMQGNVVDFTINRTLYCDGYYNTLCLPFNLATLEGTPLETATVMEYSGVEITGTNPDLTLNVTIDPVNAIVAGKPYLVSFPSGSDITNMTFHGVTISTATPQTITSEGLNMVGILAPTDLVDTENMLFLGANNTLYWSDGSNPLKGFRAYFKINGSSPAPIRHGMPARIVQKSDMATTTVTTMQRMSAQKYISNGQVVILRDGVRYNALGQIINK